MAQFRRTPSITGRRWLSADLPEFAARPRAKDNKGDEMKMQTKFSSLSLGLVASLVSATAPAQAPACKQPQYTVTDLGVLGKGNSGTTNDMNSLCGIACQSNLVPNGPLHSFLWYGNGPLVDLGTLGGPNSGADGTNLYGEVLFG